MMLVEKDAFLVMNTICERKVLAVVSIKVICSATGWLKETSQSMEYGKFMKGTGVVSSL